MPRKLGLKGVGVLVSTVLAVPYALVMLAGLLIVGWSTTGSWQAVFLGIGWSTLAGFEIGLLGIVSVGFAFAVVFVPAHNTVRGRLTSRSKTSPQPSQPSGASGRSWAFRLLSACLVLPVLNLVALHGLASVFPADLASGGPDANVLGPGAQSEPMDLGATINTAHREAEPSFTARHLPTSSS